MRDCKMKLLVLLAIASLFARPSFAQDVRDAANDNSPTVYRTDGKALGSDPDARVRFELLREQYNSDY